MGRLELILLLMVFALSIIPTVHAEEPACVYFFYGDGCQHCARSEPAINTLEAQSEFPVEVHRFEIYNNRSNMLLLNGFFGAYNVSESDMGIPAVFVSNKYLIGDTPIISSVMNLARESAGTGCPSTDQVNGTGDSGSSSPLEKMGSLSLATVIGAALVDSINPCAIAVLLILLGALLASGDKKRALKAGLAFTVSIYIAYFLFGIGLFSAIQISGMSFWFYKLIGLIAVIIGIANIKDYFWYGGGGFAMEVPRSWRPRLKSMLSGATSPAGAFVIGFAVCLFELPCTGGPYIVILGLLAERMTMFAALPLLLLYNVVFVLPLLIITFLVYSGFANVGKTSEWKDKNIRKLHLVAGIVMLALGLAITLGFV